MQTKDRSRTAGIRRFLGTLILAALAAVLVVALAGVGTAASAPGASAAAKRAACKPAAINSLPTAKAKRNRRRDCRDKRLGAPNNPRRQRYDGKRIPTKNSARCDILDRAVCLQPWPNDYFTIADASRDTGRRINLNTLSTATNINGAHIDTTDYNRADGFSPGQLIVTHVPGLNNPQALAKTNPVGLKDLHAYTKANTPIVVINAATGERHPIFAELDTRTTGNNVNVEIRPSVNFDEGQRYIVAMRNLKRSSGKVIPPSKVFRLYRDRLITRQKPVESRRKKMESIFRTLKGSGIARGNLYLAWDFTVASADSIAGRVLAMRDDAFADLGDTNLANNIVEGSSPNFTIDSVVSAVDCTGACSDPNEADDALRIIEGTIEVPCYLSHPTDADECAPGSEFAFSGPDDLTPNRVGNATSDVPFRCLIPDSVVGAGPAIDDAAPSLVGHGLLGNRGIINSTGVGANENNIFQCGMNWAGFSSDDIITGIAPSLTNLSNFPKIGDHVLQAFVNILYLGRAMIHEDGFVDDEAFQIDPDDPEDLNPAAVDSDPVIDTDDLFYWGISHGGIMGGSLTALAPDHRRAVLNVPAMNHSTLLERSIQWDNYGSVYYASYPNPIQDPQTLSMIQMLWDRAESNGYAHHMTTDPYPNTPSHTVLMQVSYGDHQVTNYAAEVMARTIGARIMTPALDAGLHWDSNPFMGIPAITSFPYLGSAMVYWYGGPTSFPGLSGQGTAKPPLTNIPNRASAGGGGDPHEYIIKDPEGRQQLSDFLQLGQLDDCGGDPPPCYSNGF